MMVGVLFDIHVAKSSLTRVLANFRIAAQGDYHEISR
jgi:hypothetical protein